MMKAILALLTALLVGAGVTSALLQPVSGPEMISQQASASAQPVAGAVPTLSPSPSAAMSTIAPVIATPPAGPVDEAGWVTTLPPGFAPGMPAATAELAVQVQPALSGLHLSTSPPAYWSLAECDWLSDTMYADIQLDSGATGHYFSAWNVPLGFWYANVVDEWQFLEGIATQACWRGGSIGGGQAATAIRDAMGNGWNGHPGHLSQDAPGSFNATWDRQWTDAYQEIATLFAEVPDAPLYFCKQSGMGDAAAASCTAASVLASLGVS